jgi:hypothetical protein
VWWCGVATGTRLGVAKSPLRRWRDGWMLVPSATHKRSHLQPIPSPDRRPLTWPSPGPAHLQEKYTICHRYYMAGFFALPWISYVSSRSPPPPSFAFLPSLSSCLLLCMCRFPLFGCGLGEVWFWGLELLASSPHRTLFCPFGPIATTQHPHTQTHTGLSTLAGLQRMH